jgi:hypothetical protein
MLLVLINKNNLKLLLYYYLMNNNIKNNNFNNLLNKIQYNVSELEILLDLDKNNTNLCDKINNIKNEIQTANLNKDITILENIWSKHFINVKTCEDEYDFM